MVANTYAYRLRIMNKKISSKVLEVIILVGFALILCFALWRVFIVDEPQTKAYSSEEETKLVALLEAMDGVGEAEVMISTNGNGVRGAVVVCDGATRLSVISDVREAVATALGIEQKYVKVYLKNQ